MQRGFGYQNRRNAGFSPASLFTGGVQGAWYDPSDSTTLFTDRAGTTPCGTPGQGSVVPVGAMLDKRAAGYSVFFDGTGDNLETPNSAAFQFGTGDFTVEGWIYPTSTPSYGIIAQCANNSTWTSGWSFLQFATRLQIWLNGNLIAQSNLGVITLNTWQHVAATRNGTTVTLWVNGSSVATATNSDNLVPTRAVSIGAETSSFNYPFLGYISNLRVVKGTAVYTGAFTPAGPLSPITGTSLLTCGTIWSGNPAITKNGDARVDGLNPFQASPVGNHAIAANDTTARPELRARVNLITNSENLAGAGWSGTATVATDVTTAPNGTTTADSITAGSTGTFLYVRRSGAGLLANVQFTWSVFAKKNTSDWVALRFWDTAPGVAAWFNLATGAVGTVQAGCTASISDQGNGWYRCVITRTMGATLAFNEIDFQVSSGDNTNNATAGNSVFLWGAQLTATNEFPANTYQRIVDANTYDAVGFPRYFVANGTSSAMSTPGNVNLSGTDKVTVFAGVRALQASVQIINELGTDTNSVNGSYVLYKNNNGVGFASRGTAINDLNNSSGTTPPVSLVLAGQSNIAAPSISLRSNGAQVLSSTATQGTGNYGTYPLFIGARNNSSLFLNGNIYSIIVVGSAVSAGQINATEQWVAGKVGITI